MSRSFLALCREFVSDLGIAGGVLQSTQGLTQQQLIRACDLVSRADLFVQNKWADWKFLWFLDTITGAAGSDRLTPNKTPATPIAFDQESMVFEPASSTTQYPQFMDWRTFYLTYQSQPKTTMPCPANWSIDPTGSIVLSHYLEAQATFAVQYRIQPTAMAKDSDTSPIPTQFDHIIVERAKILYAQRENAPEILAGSSAEFAVILSQLEAAYLPGWAPNITGQNDQTTQPDGYVV